MWLTTILYIFIFNMCFQKVLTQLSTSSNTGLNNPIISAALQNNGLTIPKNLNQIPKSQKYLNLQQINKMQQPVNLQQLNLQQASNLQMENLQQGANLQRATNLQQMNFQQSGLQPNLLQQQNLSPVLNNIASQRPDFSLASSLISNSNLAKINNPPMNKPVINGNSIQGFQSRFNPGLRNVAPATSNFNLQPTVQTSYTGFIPNGQNAFLNMPQVNQATPDQLSSISETPVINQPSLTLVAQPAPDQQSLNIIQNVPMDYQNQISIIKSVQPQASLEGIQNQLPSLNMNQIPVLSPNLPQSPDYPLFPPDYSIDSLLNTMLSKKDSKSSTLKMLLPLIFNLLKEKNTGCRCQCCGCMKDNMLVPQIFSEYAKQNNYGLRYDEKDDIETYRPRNNKRKHKKYNKEDTDSREYDDDYNDSYEDEED
ncbi:uncharacterized protein LOC128201244 [Galleria mellonella]|uniref:Uncharacterized protein LOC128201244 n=1 Tax=Galleria mellonella TaxID=7137 RepID=A0ABM3MQE4_GALME|nr:uncharacterized protein LOC128201244 [Galleria mellonella]